MTSKVRSGCGARATDAREVPRREPREIGAMNGGVVCAETGTRRKGGAPGEAT